MGVGSTGFRASSAPLPYGMILGLGDLLSILMFFNPSSEPILLDQEYPCPCNCEGRVTGIALTEAMGCFQCGQLFVLVEGGHAMMGLAANPWTGWRWRWTRQGWYRSSGTWLRSPVGLALFMVGVVLGGGVICVFLPLPSIPLFLRLVGAVSGLLLLLIFVTLFSFRVWRE